MSTCFAIVWKVLLCSACSACLAITVNPIQTLNGVKAWRGLQKVAGKTGVYYIDIDEIPGFLLLLKNHIFTARSERIIFIFHM